MTGGDILVECLKAQGVRCVFGMPGTQNIQIYDSLLRRGEGAIDHYLVRHEFAATIMADGYARSTGEVGVALTVPGPGASNASTGLLEAFTDCVPVLLITGQGHSRYYARDPSKMFHGLDQMRFFESLTKYCAVAASVDAIPRVVEEAFRAMRSGRPGPTMLEFPADVISGEGDVEVPSRVEREPEAPPSSTDVQAAAEAISAAKMPIIYAGSAVVHADAGDELRRLAENLNAPVAVTRCAKGALPEDHPLAVAHVGGFVARQAMADADCMIAVGCRFTSIDTGSWSFEPPRPLIQIEADPAEIGREYACDISVEGGLKAALRLVNAGCERRENVWASRLEKLRQEFHAQPPLPVLPQLRDTLANDAIVSVDVHAIGYGSFNEFPVYDPRTFLYPNIGVALGYAFPAALGAKVAHPDAAVVSFSGDGGFMMGAAELATAMMYGISVVAIVVNDGALSAIKGSQRRACDGRTIDTDLVNPDFVAFASSFGAYAARVDEDLSNFGDVLRDALASNRPALIEVPMGARQEEVIRMIGWLQPTPLRA